MYLIIYLISFHLKISNQYFVSPYSFNYPHYISQRFRCQAKSTLFSRFSVHNSKHFPLFTLLINSCYSFPLHLIYISNHIYIRQGAYNDYSYCHHWGHHRLHCLPIRSHRVADCHPEPTHLWR